MAHLASLARNLDLRHELGGQERVVAWIVQVERLRAVLFAVRLLINLQDALQNFWNQCFVPAEEVKNQKLTLYVDSQPRLRA